MTRGAARGFVVGLSGGIDSAVVARLCQLARPGNVLGVIMPCYSDPRDEADARLVADAFGIPAVRVDLAPTYDALVADTRAALDALPSKCRVAGASIWTSSAVPLANVKPRLRMTTLYFIANSLNYLVAGTGNRSELTIGYFTKHGDGGVDVLPIGHLLKSQVRALARSSECPSRSSTSRRAPDCGWARPTRPRWASPMPISSVSDATVPKASRPRWRCGWSG